MQSRPETHKEGLHVPLSCLRDQAYAQTVSGAEITTQFEPAVPKGVHPWRR
jgi:hypothetical protein